MKFRMPLKPMSLTLFLSSVMLLGVGSAWSQPKAPVPVPAAATPAATPAGAVVATVNGIAIPDAMLQLNIKANIAQGQKDTPELRNAVTQELIIREVLAQEATRLGLDKTPAAQAQWAQMRQGFLADLAITDFQAKHPVTDAEVKSEYDRWAATMQEAQQYRLSLILVSNEADARALLARLKKGEPFDRLAREKSIDASRNAGGVLDWVLPDQLVPAISNVVVNLAKGQTSVVPIQTSTGWNVIRLDDKRPYKVPSFEESKPAMQSIVGQKRRQEYAQKLRKEAKITP